MNDALPPTLILVVPGTQETREMDQQAIHEGVAGGEIALDNWAWSPSRKAWLPLGQLPEFAGTSVPTEPAPETAIAHPVPVVAVAAATKPVVKVAASAQTPVVRRVVRPVEPAKMAGTYYSQPSEEPNEFPIFKVGFTVLGVLVAAIVAVNYFLVDQPLRSNLAATPFAAVQVHGHLAAFVQPNTLLIHIRPGPEITPDNFADFLGTLARSAPRSAVAGIPFSTVGFTSAWISQYVMTAQDWEGFANMDGFTAQEKRQFVLSHLMRGSGEPAYVPLDTKPEPRRQADEQEAWSDLVASFHRPSAP